MQLEALYFGQKKILSDSMIIGKANIVEAQMSNRSFRSELTQGIVRTDSFLCPPLYDSGYTKRDQIWCETHNSCHICFSLLNRAMEKFLFISLQSDHPALETMNRNPQGSSF